MITKLIGATTLFAAGSLVAGTSHVMSAVAVEPFAGEAALTQAGDCGSKDKKDMEKAPAKAKDAKAKDASCGAGTCGSKGTKKAKKEGSCGKDKKEGSCGKDKK